MLTRFEADDWGDITADGTQYEQEDHGYTEHYDGSFYHQEHQDHQEQDTEQYHHGTDPDEHGYMKETHEHEHAQNGAPAESEDDYQKE
jgi:hypothetical protein